MLSRVLEGKRWQQRQRTRSPAPRNTEDATATAGRPSLTNSLHSSDEEDGWWGLGCDLPLTFCGGSSVSIGLREVLRSSVQVLGMSGLGVTEKVVLLDASSFTAKRFKKVTVRRSEFGRRVEMVAAVSRRCEYLVPVRAYLFAKRTKLVLCDYYPMGSLADLLADARELGHTPLDWQMRSRIILHVARAVAFIHSLPLDDKRFCRNVHGNIKSCNVLVTTDLSARLSDYGFAQLAQPVDCLPSDTGPRKCSAVGGKLSQKADIFNFGVVVLEVVGGSRAPHQISCIVERFEEIRAGTCHFFEYFVEGHAKVQALQVLEVALACTNGSPEARPSAENIVAVLEDALAVE